VQPPVGRGYDFTAEWNDDFHHAMHAFLTKEAGGYYQDFGKVSPIAKTLTSGYVYQGEYSKDRLRSHRFPPGVFALRAKSLHYYRAALGHSLPF
jgi:maltooligosyltrehalose trehalohydrolase